MDKIIIKAEAVLGLKHSQFPYELKDINYNNPEEASYIGFYNTTTNSFHLPRRVWSSLALHEAIHARMKAEGLLMICREDCKDPQDRWISYSRIIDEIIAELGVHSVMPLSPKWISKELSNKLLDYQINYLVSNCISDNIRKEIESEQGCKLDMFLELSKSRMKALKLAEMHTRLEGEYFRHRDLKKIKDGLAKIDEEIEGLRNSENSHHIELEYIYDIAIRNALCLAASGDSPAGLVARIAEEVKKGVPSRELYFNQIVAHKKKELRLS